MNFQKVIMQKTQKKSFMIMSRCKMKIMLTSRYRHINGEIHDNVITTRKTFSGSDTEEQKVTIEEELAKIRGNQTWISEKNIQQKGTRQC